MLKSIFLFPLNILVWVRVSTVKKKFTFILETEYGGLSHIIIIIIIIY